MRRAAKVDCNQVEIVKALRQIGASVQPLHMVGQGCPDLLIGLAGKNFLFELKDSSKPPSKRGLTTDQIEWFHAWRGQVHIAKSIEEALAIIGRLSGVMK